MSRAVCRSSSISSTVSARRGTVESVVMVLLLMVCGGGRPPVCRARGERSTLGNQPERGLIVNNNARECAIPVIRSLILHYLANGVFYMLVLQDILQFLQLFSVSIATPLLIIRPAEILPT
jgi:hypothetical protein